MIYLFINIAPCKYSKGNWSACADGLRSRIDEVKGNSEGCESFRTVTRKCKVICRYSRSDWGPCEGSLKTKKLTLVEGNPGVCEVSKSITKQCGGQGNGGSNTGKSGGGSSNGSGLQLGALRKNRARNLA